MIYTADNTTRYIDPSCEKLYSIRSTSTTSSNSSTSSTNRMVNRFQKIKRGFKTMLWQTDSHKEKRAQDGRTNPME
jgi:hypothetical protein